MISQRWRHQRRCSPCIRSWTSFSDKCVAARVMRLPIRLVSFPCHDSFLDYHTECKWIGLLCTQPLSTTTVVIRGHESLDERVAGALVVGNDFDGPRAAS